MSPAESLCVIKCKMKSMQGNVFSIFCTFESGADEMAARLRPCTTLLFRLQNIPA